MVRAEDALVYRIELPVIFESKSIIIVLLANCPHEAEPVNSQVSPCNTVLPDVHRLCGLLQS